MGMARKIAPKPSGILRWGLRVLSLAVAAYGGYAFVKREVGRYMLLKSHFVFFDLNSQLRSEE